ncbi:hypothetical protein Fot_57071 [Forsythia ovata]|uniref:Uncharacterized protein n=1 Tax=Forsythia ovata TaxID=205694 RepID=A0ABD1NWX0_9LAMI
MEAIPNLFAGMNTPNQGIPAREAGFSKLKKPFTSPYCTYHRFYGHRTKDCRDIQALAKQRTQRKDHPSFGRNGGKNKSPYRSNELRCGRRQEARDKRHRREIRQRERGRSQERENVPMMERLDRN